jgi:hypothetical protein
MPSHEKAISRLRLKITLFLFFRQFVVLLAVWGFLWGTVVLVLRGGFGVSSAPLPWGLAGLPLAIGAAVCLAKRRVPSSTAVRALLDKRARCGGLLMAAEVTDIGNWQEEIPSPGPLLLRVRNPRNWAFVGSAAAFVMMSFLIPQRLPGLASPHELEVGREVEKIAAQVEALQEEEIVESARAEELKEKLEQIRKEASGEDPVKTWEALDHLENLATTAAQKATEEALAQTEQLARAETLAEALSEGEADSQLMTEAMKELSEMVQDALDQSESLKRRLAWDTQAACQAGSLKPAQLSEVLHAVRLSKVELLEKLENLCGGGLIDAKILKECERLAECDSSDLIAFLEENMGEYKLCDLVALWRQSVAGRGGVSRGRGDAPLTFGQSSSEEGVEFKELTLPAATVAAMKKSHLMGLSTAAPPVETSGETAKPGALMEAEAGGGAARTQTILPRHRGAVKRYFGRE